MFRAADLALIHDEDRMVRERKETDRVISEARAAAARAERIAAKVHRMNELYRERLMGLRRR